MLLVFKWHKGFNELLLPLSFCESRTCLGGRGKVVSNYLSRIKTGMQSVPMGWNGMLVGSVTICCEVRIQEFHKLGGSPNTGMLEEK